MERIETLVYTSSSGMEGTETTLYLTGPTEFLCAEVAKQLKDDAVWTTFFGDNIDAYKRMDYGIRSLPALRIYNNTYAKNFESWFIEGDLICDLIFPANIRRTETQQMPDTMTAALLQQFRRPNFFASMCDKVPGLNELGKRFEVDKALAFEWQDELIPLTQITLNFRIDLRKWDEYLETDYRSKADPFVRTLEDLQEIVTTIQGFENGDINVEIDADQEI